MPSDDPFGTSLDAISLRVRAGEIVGIAGVSGNGQQELLAALSGERPVTNANAIRIDGVAVGQRWMPRSDARSASRSCPRIVSAAVRCPDMSLAENALLTAHREGMVRNGFVRRATASTRSRARRSTRSA